MHFVPQALRANHGIAAAVSLSKVLSITAEGKPQAPSAFRIDLILPQSIVVGQRANFRFLYVIIDYEPRRGQPSSPFAVIPVNQSITVMETLPAFAYEVKSTAMFSNGTQLLFSNETIFSSPEMPTMLETSATDNSLTISYSPSSGSDSRGERSKSNSSHRHAYSYFLEYWKDMPKHQSTEYSAINESSVEAFFLWTNSTTIRLGALESSSPYNIRIFSVFNGVKSSAPLELRLHTKKASKKSASHFFSRIKKPSNRTDNPKRYFSRVTALVNCKLESIIPENFKVTINPTEKDELYKTELPPDIFIKSTRRPNLPVSAQSKTNLTSREPVASTKASINTTLSSSSFNKSKDKIELIEQQHATDQQTDEPSSEEKKAKQSATTKKTPVTKGQAKNDENNFEREEEALISNTDMNTNGTVANISVSSADGKELLLRWLIPSQLICDSFSLDYIIKRPPPNVDTPKPGTKSVILSETPPVKIPYLQGAMIEINCYCVLESMTVDGWKAYRVLDLERPKRIENLRVEDVLTDQFYRSSVVLKFDVPKLVDPDLYEIELEWTFGKESKLNRVVLAANDGFQANFVNVSNLEAAKLYTFKLKNVSKELSDLRSASVGLKQITRMTKLKKMTFELLAPIITSTVYPGIITSNSVNVNFDESSSDYDFDAYELHFESSLKNITIKKKLEKNDPKSFDFNKLVPGETYRFKLYTVYKFTRSRPVVLDITTYPSKVKSLRVIAGPSYATLFWAVQMTDAPNSRRFRLSYSSTSNRGIQKSLTIDLNGTTVQHRFSELDSDTYYTFTIIVIAGPEYAEAESDSEATTIGFAGRPKSDLLSVKRYGTRELLITFEKTRELFNDMNGQILNFAVIVAEDTDQESFDLPSWYDVHDTELWPSYRASPSNYNPFQDRRFSSSMAKFLVGSEDCDQRQLDEQYCNGVLKARAEYFVKVRAYTNMPIAIETNWASVEGVVDETSQKESSEKKRKLPCYMYLNNCFNRAQRFQLSLPSELFFPLAFIIMYFARFF